MLVLVKGSHRVSFCTQGRFGVSYGQKRLWTKRSMKKKAHRFKDHNGRRHGVCQLKCSGFHVLNQPDRDSVGTEKEEERAGVGGRQDFCTNAYKTNQL